MIVVFIAVCGGVGSVTRFITDTAVRARISTKFPVGTVLVNVTGSFVLALLAGLSARAVLPSDLYAIAGVGFCGGYTTFSTASVEVVRLAQAGRLVSAGVYGFGSLLATLLASACGVAVASIC